MILAGFALVAVLSGLIGMKAGHDLAEFKHKGEYPGDDEDLYI